MANSKRSISLFLALLLIMSLLPANAYATGSANAEIRATSATASPGTTIDVDVLIENSPGILGATIGLSYDPGLTLIGAKNGDAFSVLTMTPPGRFESPCKFIWDGQEISSEDIKDGVILTLTFMVSENATIGGRQEIRIGYEDGDILDGDLIPVDVTMINGSISVIDYTPGDLNGDEKVNSADVVLMRRHIVGGYDVSINEDAADVNEDGRVNSADVVLLRRYIVGGYDVVLKPSQVQNKCDHTMEATAAKAVTCAEDGNIAYWYCTTCQKYFNSAAGTKEIAWEDTILIATGHTVVIDEAVPATYTSTGLTAGSHCSVCGEVIIPQEVIPKLESKQYSISYDIPNGDSYLAAQTINNQNPSAFSEGESVTLRNLSVPGYRFLGWFDGAGNNAIQVRKIEADTRYDVELYAHWEKIEYSVQFKSDLYLPVNEISYTVDRGVVLPKPQLSNYVFAGWSDDNGKLYSSTTIPVGTTGDYTLTANWTSERNKTWTKTQLDAPVIHVDEENNVILFAYEIGEIQNVPLYTIKDFGYIAEGGITKTETTTYSTTISETAMESYTRAVASATTESSSWTLSDEWNETTSIDEQWCQENGYTQEQAETIAKSDTNTWNVSSGKSGSTDVTRLDTNQDNWENEVKVNSSKETTNSDKVAASVSSEIGAKGFGVEAKISADLSVEETSSTTKKSGMEIGGARGNTSISTDSTTSNSSWNNSSSYGGSSTVSGSTTASTALSEKISNAYGYGKSYASGGTSSDTQGLSSSTSTSDEYSSSVTYSTSTSASVTSTWTTQATKSGYHRWIVAGTAHVFAVVGYDMSAESFFVYTYSVMDDETHEFEDYSYSSNAYNDMQNGVISFSIPNEVAEYVSDYTSYSSGLKVDMETGTITGYNGDDDCVVIPEYMNVGNGDVVKITDISSNAFKGNTEIKAVVLSDFITKIPDNAFEGCTSLIGVIGGAVTEIGSKAFNGCTAIEDCVVTDKITKLGARAFEGANRLLVKASSAEVIESAINSGANKIVLHLNALTNGADDLEGRTLNIPEGTEYFEFNGYGNAFTNLTLVSGADETVISKASFVSNSAIPIQLSSSQVAFDQVSVNAYGIAMVMSAEETSVGLRGTVNANSENGNAALCKNITLYEMNSNIDGKLVVTGKLLVCGSIVGENLLYCDEIEYIDADTYSNMLNAYILYFDAAGGSCSEVSREVANSTAIGDLPVPTRENYSFVGWYLADGTPVTEETVFSTGLDQTIYAQWIEKTFTIYLNADGGTCGTTSITAAYNTAVGSLPTATRTGYNFHGWFTEKTGGTQITESTTFSTSNDITLYARWVADAYSASWSTGTGYSISVKRISSPYAGVATGNLNSGATVYYGDVLNVSYLASLGYSLQTTGATTITISQNITSSDIYATATANSYTYSIVYKSSNGTSLGTSSATYTFGTTNTISAPVKSGYTTPSSQSVKWDATAKTITFTYSPTAVGNGTKTGTISSSPNITYSATVEYRNRTASSVQLRVVWTSTIRAGSYTVYGQRFTASVGSVSTGATQVAAFNAWRSSSSSNRSSTGTSGWITVPLSTTNATSVSMPVYYYQVNSNGTDMYKYNGTPAVSATWSISVPAY